MGSWTKYYADNTHYQGTDDLVRRRIASWRNTQLISMIACDLVHDDGYKLRIEGTGNYWQSDSYESIYPLPQATIIKRRIEKQIDSSNRFFRQCQNAKGTTICFDGILHGGKYLKVPASWYGKWFILEYDVRTRVCRYYIKDGKV